MSAADRDGGDGQARGRRPAAALLRRRRAVAIAAIAAIGAFVVGVVLGAVAGDDEADTQRAAAERAARETSGGLGDRELAGQRLIAGWDGLVPPPGLRKLIARGGVAGVILFADNVSNDGQAKAVIRSLQRIPRPEGLDQPLLVMVDQEGGQVERLEAAPETSAEGIGAIGSDYAREQGVATGEQLAALGFNVDLAPVLDIARPGGSIDREQRSFGSGAEAVTASGLEFAKGLEKSGVVATAKHFPGIGSIQTNTDFASQKIDASIEQLRSVDEVPFERFVENGGEMVMLSLAIYPAFANRPAAFSPNVVSRELRGRLGFDGVTITDGLGAAAAAKFGDTGKVALAAASAGNDLLLHTDWRDARDVGRLLGRRLREGELGRKRFEESVARVLALRRRR